LRVVVIPLKDENPEKRGGPREGSGNTKNKKEKKQKEFCSSNWFQRDVRSATRKRKRDRKKGRDP